MTDISNGGDEFEFQEAKEILSGPFGKQLLQVVRGCTSNFFWFSEKREERALNSGTIFFLDTGVKAFAVTAYHVFEAYEEALKNYSTIKCQVSNISFNPSDRVIDFSSNLDIVTFDITEKELKKINKSFFSGYQKDWPPLPPQVGKGVFFVGYPGNERKNKGKDQIEFGLFLGFCAAERVSDRNISIQFNREYSVDCSALGFEPMPDGYDLGGVSGAPLISLVQNKSGLIYWRFAGVIYEAHKDYGLLFATRADYILPDGTLRKI